MGPPLQERRPIGESVWTVGSTWSVWSCRVAAHLLLFLSNYFGGRGQQANTFRSPPSPSPRSSRRMARSRILLPLSLALASLFVAALADGDVLVLTEANFEEEVGRDRGALVEFYAPWYPSHPTLSESTYCGLQFVSRRNRRSDYQTLIILLLCS